MIKPVQTQKVSDTCKEKQSSGSRRQLLKPQQVRDEDEETSNNEDKDGDGSGDDSGSDSVSASEMYKLPEGLDHFKTTEELSAVKPHLQSVSYPHTMM